jgi:hypothetical protein
MSQSYLMFLKLNSKKSSYKLLDNIDKENENYVTYYCANVVEDLFNCSNQLTYIKNGGFGVNYRYCSACYQKWNDLKRQEEKLKQNV